MLARILVELFCTVIVLSFQLVIWTPSSFSFYPFVNVLLSNRFHKIILNYIAIECKVASLWINFIKPFYLRAINCFCKFCNVCSHRRAFAINIICNIRIGRESIYELIFICKYIVIIILYIVYEDTWSTTNNTNDAMRNIRNLSKNINRMS